MPKPLPKRLRKEPIIDAGCELRVQATVDLHTVMPGLLFSRLPNVGNIEQLPAQSIPEPLRAADPSLVSVPLVKVDWGRYLLLVGARNISVTPKLPYPGWETFRQDILQVFRLVLENSFVLGVERYSIKYVNLIEIDDLAGQFDALDWAVRIGPLQLSDQRTQLKTEISSGEFITIVQLITSASVRMTSTNVEKHGCVVDVDTVCSHATRDIAAFRTELEDRLRSIRLQNKIVFFDCLKDSTIDALEPEYE